MDILCAAWASGGWIWSPYNELLVKEYYKHIMLSWKVLLFWNSQLMCPSNVGYVFILWQTKQNACGFLHGFSYSWELMCLIFVNYSGDILNFLNITNFCRLYHYLFQVNTVQIHICTVNITPGLKIIRCLNNGFLYNNCTRIDISLFTLFISILKPPRWPRKPIPSNPRETVSCMWRGLPSPPRVPRVLPTAPPVGK